MANKNVCEIAMCGAPLPDGRGSHGGLMLCDACRSAQYYWRKQGSDALIHRAARLQLYEERMAYLAPIVAKNVKRVKEQMSDLYARASRTAATKLGETRAIAYHKAKEARAG